MLRRAGGVVQALTDGETDFVGVAVSRPCTGRSDALRCVPAVAGGIRAGREALGGRRGLKAVRAFTVRGLLRRRSSTCPKAAREGRTYEAFSPLGIVR